MGAKVNATKTYQFKAKDSEIKKYPLCLEKISGDFSANSTKQQDQMDVCTILLLIIEPLKLVILSISIII